MHINDLIWLDKVVEKIERKHRVSREEVEEHFTTVRYIVKHRRLSLKVRIYTMLMGVLIAVDIY